MSIAFHKIGYPTGTSWICAALGPEGRLAASGEVGKVALWEVCSGRRIATLTAGRDRVLSLAFSDDGRWLWAGTDSGDEGRTLWRWCLDPLQKQAEGMLAHYRTSALSLRGDRLLSGGGEDDGEWILWSVSEMSPVQASGPAEGEILSVALDERGWAVLRAVSGETVLEIHDISSLRHVPVKQACTIGFSPDGQKILVALAEHVLPVGRLDGAVQRPIRAPYLRVNLKGQPAPSGDTWFGPGLARAGRNVLCCERGRLAAYSGKKLLWTTEGQHPLRALTIVSKEHLAGCRGDTVFLWRTTGELLWSCQLEQQPIRLASDPWGRWLVALGESFTYLRLQSGEVVHTGPENVGASMAREDGFASMRFAPELSFPSISGRDAWTPVAVGSDRDLSVLWDGRSLNLGQRRSGPRYEGFATATHACLGPDWVVLASDSSVARFQRESGCLLGRCEARAMAGSGLAVTANGSVVLRCSLDRLEAWGLSNSQRIGNWAAPEPLWSCAGSGACWAGGLSGTLYRVDIAHLDR